MIKKIGIIVFSIAVMISFCALVFSPKDCAAKEPIKIGMVWPMSAAYAAYGMSGEAGMKVAAKRINDTGGILGRPVEITVMDSKMNPQATLKHLRDYVAKGYQFLGGPASSTCAIAAGAYVQGLKGKALWSATYSSAKSITEEHGGRYVFRLGVTDYTWSFVSARYAAEKYGNERRRLYLLNYNDSWGIGVRDEFVRVWREMVPEAEVVGESFPERGCKDFTPFISAMLAKKADVVQASIAGGDTVTFYKQAAQFGLLNKLIAVNGHLGDRGVSMAFKRGEPGVPIGAIGVSEYPYYLVNTPESQKFAKQVEAHAGLCGEMSTFGEQYVLFLKAAMEKAGTTTNLEKIIDALEGITINSHSVGKTTMRACDHNSFQPIWVGEIGWDTRGEMDTYILTRESAVKCDDYENIYHSCEHIAKVREAFKKKR